MGAAFPLFAGALLDGVLAGDPMSLAIVVAVLLLVLVAVATIPPGLMRLIKGAFFLALVAITGYYLWRSVGTGAVLGDPVVEAILAVSGIIVLATFVLILLPAAGSGEGSDGTRASAAQAQGETTTFQPVGTSGTASGRGRTPQVEPTRLDPPQMLTTQALTRELSGDRSLLAVLTYVIVAEFGVFSSRTIAAPNPTVGLVFSGIFFLGAFLFLRSNYDSYARGVAHLLVATVFGVLLSLLLGHYWNGIPLATLLGVGYFATAAAVAVVTGIAVSLLMGSRG